MDYFNTFYSMYPRKVARVVAQKAATKIPDSEWANVIEGLKKYLTAWSGKDKSFIPHPATFLNQRRWEDEIEVVEEARNASLLYTFLKEVRKPNSFTFPDMSPELKQNFYRIGIKWSELKKMSDEQITMAWNNDFQPKRDGKIAASGEGN